MQAGPPGYRLHQAAGIADHVENNSGTSHEYRYGDVTSLDYTGLGTTSRMLSGYRNTNQDLDLGDLHVHTSQAQGPYSYAPDIDVDFGDDRGGESSTERLQCPTGKHPPLNSERLIRECRRDCVPSMWPGPTRRS